MTSNMIAYRNLQEAEKHDREVERLQGEKQAEEARHYHAVEAEQQRANKASEANERFRNIINAVSAMWNKKHVETSDYYTYVRPATYDYDLKQYDSKIAEAEAKAAESRERAALYTSQIGNVEADTALKRQQTQNVWAQTWYNQELAKSEEWKRTNQYYGAQLFANKAQGLRNLMAIKQANRELDIKSSNNTRAWLFGNKGALTWLEDVLNAKPY